MLRNHPIFWDIITQLKHGIENLGKKVESTQFMLVSAILELLHDPFTELFYGAFEQYWRKLRPAFFARNLLLCHALDRGDLCSDPCDPALFI